MPVEQFCKYYMTSEEEHFMCMCEGIYNAPSNSFREDGKYYFMFLFLYDASPLVDVIEATPLSVTRADFYADPRKTIFEAFSAFDLENQEEIVDFFADELCSYVQRVSESPEFGGSRDLQFDITLSGPIPDENEDEDRVSRELASVVAVRTVPASREAIEGIEEVSEIKGRRTRVRVRAREKYSDITCTVCMEDLVSLEIDDWVDDSDVLRLPCQHLYHKKCIVQWLETSHLCPICRYHMPSSS